MKSDRIMHLFQDPGPFASAYVDLSQDQQDAPDFVQLNVRAACDALTDAGAPEPVVSAVRSALGVVPDRADRVLVAAAALTGAEIDVAPASMMFGAPAAALLRWEQPAERDRA